MKAPALHSPCETGAQPRYDQRAHQAPRSAEQGQRVADEHSGRGRAITRKLLVGVPGKRTLPTQLQELLWRDVPSDHHATLHASGDGELACVVGQFVNVYPVVLGPQTPVADTADEAAEVQIVQQVGITGQSQKNKAIVA